MRGEPLTLLVLLHWFLMACQKILKSNERFVYLFVLIEDIQPGGSES